MSNLLLSIKATLAATGIRPAQPLYVSVSGGADSIALLHLLHQTDHPCHILHLNHQLRGTDSDQDQQFVETLATQLHLPITIKRIDVAAHASQHKQSLELAGRHARHQLYRTCTDAPIALARHADDQLETFLLRLTRGAGTSGLSGMQPIQSLDNFTLLRPLLNHPKADLIQWLQQQQLPWREDATNTDPAHTRNRIRHHIIPLLQQELNPNLLSTITRTMTLLSDEDHWLEQQARTYTAQTVATAPKSLQRRWIRHWLHQQQIDDIPFETVEQIMQALQQPDGTRHCDINAAFVVRIEYGIPTLQPRNDLSPPPEWTLTQTEGTGWQPNTAHGIGILPAHASISLAQLNHRALHVRPPRPGDRFQPLGMQGHRKLQDILTDQKVPLAQRNQMPVVCCEDEIVWLPGYAIAHHWRLANQHAPALHLHLVKNQ